MNWELKAGGGGLPYADFTALYSTDGTTAWTAGWSSTIYKTTDGGTNWQYYSPPVHVYERSIFFTNAQTGWLSGYGYVCKTTNGGINWSIQSSQEGADINSVKFINSS
ncbi:unnamed protein product, partial [Rotaria sp. Silwood1]